MSLEDIQQANNNYMDIVRAWKSFIYVLFYLIRTTLVKYEYALLMKMVFSLYCSTICNFCNTTRKRLKLPRSKIISVILCNLYLFAYLYLLDTSSMVLHKICMLPLLILGKSYQLIGWRRPIFFCCHNMSSQHECR